MSKADKLGVSASFARAQPVGVSSRRAAIAEATGAPTSGVVPPSEVPIEALAHNPFNLREDLTELDELAQSLVSRASCSPSRSPPAWRSWRPTRVRPTASAAPRTW